MRNKEVIIEPTTGWRFPELASLWEYRDLLYFLSIRGIKIKYADSILGIGWAVLNPLIQALLFTVVFGNLAKLSSDGTPYILFSFTAMVVWTYFSGILTEATDSVLGNRGMIGKVYFPRLVLPLASVFNKFVDFAVAFLVLVMLLVYYAQAPSWTIIYLPILLAMLLLTSLGAGCLLAALAVQFRDVKYAMSFLVRILMYSAPVVYSVDLIPRSWQILYAANPMVGVIEGMRSIFLQTRPFPWNWVAVGFLSATVIFLVGTFYFRRTERLFADIA